MVDPFVHLRVASGYSLQYGASHPHVLVERAAELGMDTLALTDRDGTYGAVKFVQAAGRHGVRPVLGVDLACRPVLDRAVPPRPRSRRTPARGGAYRDPRLPRVTVLAVGSAGWTALCRLVTATHRAGERGAPVTTRELVAEHAAGGALLVLLGPTSELGEAVGGRRADRARAVLGAWQQAVPTGQLRVELVSHRLAGHGPGSTPHAARTAAVAGEAGVPTVLSNAVRYADRADAPVVDVLDAARRLVPLEARHVDRRNAEGHLKSGPEMTAVAAEVCRHAGTAGDPDWAAEQLLARTRATAEQCVLDPGTDLGMGQVFLPELAEREAVGATPRPGQSRADAALAERCDAALGARYGPAPSRRVHDRLHEELATIAGLGFASYFLTVADVTDLVRERGIRVAARGSGAGSLVNYLLGISGVDPVRHGLLMERFCSPLRTTLPDIDIDVESARRLEVYEAILARYGDERCACVSMMETYRVRHAVRDVGAALGMPPGEVDAIAKAFPHVRARDARAALAELPELRRSGLDQQELSLLFRLVERLDGLPRHVALHPCGVLLSDTTLLDRTPVEASADGYPTSQFDKDDVEELGLLKLDVLGVRMQSAMAHAVAGIARVEGVRVDLEDERQVPHDDPATYRLISDARTLGVFQIESPGQRELVAKSGIASFEEIITDISLFRPGPVKSDMVTPYLEAKQGWTVPVHLHEDLRPVLEETHGVVVFHEQVTAIIALFTGVTLAEAEEKRRALGDHEHLDRVGHWFLARARGRGYARPLAERIWGVLASFASFGFCKAHAAAFALPTYQSAWLKAHYPAYFLAGVLTHDPGMYPKRLILDDARQRGIAVLGLDINASGAEYAVERVTVADGGRSPGIRLALSEVKGISEAEVDRIVAARPYRSLTDFWQRAGVSRPVVERLVLAGGFDTVYGLEPTGVRHRGRVTRRDLLLQVAELDQRGRADARAGRVGGRSRGIPGAGARSTPASSVQLGLELGDEPGEAESHGLPEMTPQERTRAELEILGLDASRHVLEEYADLLTALGVTRSTELLGCRSRSELLVAGVKVATQTPPVRSGRRVVFCTLDDATGPVDATFFSDAQAGYATTVFDSWLLVVRGELRRTGHRGVSLRATGAWDLPALRDQWHREGGDAVAATLAADPTSAPGRAAPSRRRRLVHSSGFAMSPYSDVRPAGEDPRQVPRRLWHRSPGSPG